MVEIDIDKEWNFIIHETHNGDKNNRIERELLFVLECELSRENPNYAFYEELKKVYLKNTKL